MRSNKLRKNMNEFRSEKSKGYKKIKMFSIALVPLMVAPLGVIAMSTNAKASEKVNSTAQSSVTNTTLADANTEYTVNTVVPGYGLSYDQAKKAEGRWISHANFRPTGFFVTANTPVTIKTTNIVVPSAGEAPLNNVYAAVGQWYEWTDINDGLKIAPEKFSLTGEETQFTPKTSGMLHIWNERNADITVQSISGPGLTVVPTFTQDQTDLNDFINAVQTTTAPIIEIVGKRVFITIQKSVVLKAIAKTGLVDLNDRTKMLDTFVSKANELYGLNENYDGSAHKYGQLVNYMGRDIPGGGTYANAPSQFINMFNSASLDILTSDLTKSWGIQHELGHTYQTPDYLWTGLTEVTVNLLPLYLAEYYNVIPKHWASILTDTTAYFALPVAERNFDVNSGTSAKLAMFWQLHMAFGDNFYPTLSQLYRVLYPEQRPASSDEKEQLFMIMASKVAQRDLTPFFKQWGLPITDDTAQKIAALNLPALSNDIWTNILQPNKIVENEVPAYVPTPRDYTEIKQFPFGSQIAPYGYDEYYTHTAPITRVDLDYLGLTKIDNTWSVPVKVYQKGNGQIENMFNDLHQVDMTNVTTLKFVSSASKLTGYLGIDYAAGLINFVGNSTKFSTGDATLTYGTLTIKDKDGVVKRVLTLKNGDDWTSFIVANNLQNGLPYTAGDTLTVAFVKPGNALQFNPAAEVNDFVKLTNKETIFNLV